MNISKIFIQKPVMTTLLIIAVIAFGLGAYMRLPVASLPSVNFPIITIKTSYPGASPQTVADTVTTPIETQCMQISGLTSIISTSSEGNSQIVLTFSTSTDVNYAISNVQIALSRASHNLPKDLTNPPTFNQVDPSAKPIMYVIMSSDSLSHDQLYELAENRLVKPISIIDGVAQVTVRSVPSAIILNLDPMKMASFGVTLTDVDNALNDANVSYSGGTLSNEYKTLSIVPNGELTTPEQYNSIIVKDVNDTPITISDIGKAIESTTDPYFHLTAFNNKTKDEIVNPILLEITRQNGSNTVDIANQIKAQIKQLEKNIPQSVHLSIIYDASQTIISSVNDVKLTLLLAFIFVVVVVFLFIGRLRETIIPTVVIPVTIVITFLIMYLVNFSIDNLSLMAITLAIGFIVDDAIVVLENAIRYIENGYSVIDAAVKSAGEISGSVISMSASLIIVFIPIVFMGGIVGLVFREFALTVIIAIIASCVVSLSMTPLMNSKFLKHLKTDKPSRFVVLKDKFLDSVLHYYGILLKKFLKRKYLTISVWFICLLGTLLLFSITQKTFIPSGDAGDMFGQMVFPLGVSHVQTAKFQQYVNNILKTDPNVEQFFTMTGMSTGADQSTGMVRITLKPYSQRPPIDQVIKELKAKFAKIPFPLGKIYLMADPVLSIPTGGSNAAQGSMYEYTLTGSSQSDVSKYGTLLYNKMLTMSEFTDVQTSIMPNLPQVEININRNKAGQLGISANDIESALNMAFSQNVSTQYNEGTDQYDVIIQNADRYSENIDSLSQMYVKSSTTGALIPLSEIASIIKGVGPDVINHTQQLDSATISFNLKNGVSLGDATDAINSIAKTMFPSSVQGSFGGTAGQFVTVIASMSFLILIAVFLEYIILGILYESYIYPLTVIATLPTATVGGLFTVYIFGSELSLYAYIGIFMLLGLVAKNGIILIDFAIKKMREENVSAHDAIYEACIVRFRPIVMTGVAAIMGALPIALGFGSDASLREPLGLIVVGGLIVSQIITLFVTPGIFIILDKLRKKDKAG